MATPRKTVNKTKKVELVDVPEVEEVERVETVATKKVDRQNISRDYAYRTKEALEKEEKVKIFIPYDELNPDLNIAEVDLNGYKYQIPRGEEYEVPKSIYEIWKESYEKTLRAERRVAETGRSKEPVASL